MMRLSTVLPLFVAFVSMASSAFAAGSELELLKQEQFSGQKTWCLTFAVDRSSTVQPDGSGQTHIQVYFADGVQGSGSVLVDGKTIKLWKKENLVNIWPVMVKSGEHKFTLSIDGPPLNVRVFQIQSFEATIEPSCKSSSSK